MTCYKASDAKNLILTINAIKFPFYIIKCSQIYILLIFLKIYYKIVGIKITKIEQYF